MSTAWVSFCISTFKRPEFLRVQLALLLRQTYPHFEIVISDNDPLETGRDVAEEFKDHRIKYFANGENVGMIASFNKSIDRANTEFVVMVTDDDPITEDFLATFYEHYQQHPHLSIYCGFERKGKQPSQVEVISKDNFLSEVLHPERTPWLLWSSSIMKKTAVLMVGKMPDFGSPHLADHALIAMTGSIYGGLIMNKKFSDVTLHKTNYSKSNFRSYVIACKGFYDLLTDFCKSRPAVKENRRVILLHLYNWFIGSFFNLKKYYSVNYDPAVLEEVNAFGREITSFHFMRSVRLKYNAKLIIFFIKWKLKLLK